MHVVCKEKKKLNCIILIYILSCYSKAKLERPWYNDQSDDNDVAEQAFQSLMTITLKKPNDEKYRNFSDEVKARAKIEQNNTDFEYGEDEVSGRL